MKTVFVIIAAALLVAAAPAVAQIDLPHEMYGEPLELNYDNLELAPDGPYDPQSHDSDRYFMCLSPDGQLIAYPTSRVWGPSYDIFTVPAAGGEVNHLFNILDSEYHSEGKSIMFVSFLPDNQRISYVSDFKIATIDIMTGEEELIIEGGHHPQWDPNGRYMLYDKLQYPKEGSREWALYDLQTSEEVFLKDILGVDSFHIKSVESVIFSHDGASIFYAKHDESGVLQVYRASLTGTQTEQVTAFLPRTDSYSTIQNIDCSIRYWSQITISLSHDERWLVLCVGPGINMDYTILYDLIGHRVYNLFTREEISLDLNAVYAYWYRINDREYEYDDVQPRFFGWLPDGQSVLIFGNEPLGDNVYLKDLSTFFQANTPTAVESDTPAAFPTLASYPNPFNPSTTISFTLPKAGYTELAVYNLAGQKIRTLVAGELSTGAHEVVWDGRDDSGNPVSSGIFVSRLVTGDNVVTNRMTLVK
ncbi:FlgD immunoglobulin-like domain containing protein [Candidatus Latescibacterota bacterium]